MKKKLLHSPTRLAFIAASFLVFLLAGAARVGMRRGGRKWAQDEGLALFLVVDRLLPDWPVLVFGPEPVGATELLERSVSGGVAAPSHD